MPTAAEKLVEDKAELVLAKDFIEQLIEAAEAPLNTRPLTNDTVSQGETFVRRINQYWTDTYQHALRKVTVQCRKVTPHEDATPYHVQSREIAVKVALLEGRQLANETQFNPVVRTADPPPPPPGGSGSSGPKVSVPIFVGNPLAYRTWRTRMTEMIADHPSSSAATKVSWLQEAIKDEGGGHRWDSGDRA